MRPLESRQSDPHERRKIMRWKVNLFSGTILCFLLAQSGATQQQPAVPASADWPMYRHDLAGTGYSPLTQINTRNVSNLSQVWTFGLQSDVPAAPPAGGRGGPGGALNSEATKIDVSGVMYLSMASHLDAVDEER